MHNALQDAGLRGKGYSLHSLRHTFATEMLNAGMRIEVLQQLLGHQEIGITMRYAKLADRTREEEYFRAMDRIKKGRHYEPDRINTQLQKVFEEKKLLHAKHKKLSE
jgi:integrase